MLTRRSILVLAAWATTALSGIVSIAPAKADGIAPQPYTQDAFEAAEKAGKPILIDTYATWCDICARQMPILEKLRGEAKYRDLVTFTVNFDTQKDVMHKLDARVQSTLIVFRGAKEVGRSVSETQEEWIDDLLSKTLVKSTS